MLAAVLFTDIVGSTARATQLGDGGWRDILSRHHTIVRAELVRFGGREVDPAGDGFLAVFDVPASAVRCARSAIDALAPLGLQIRAGVHMGEVSLIGDKVGGIAAHIGARVMATAGASEVLVSSTVKDLVTGSSLVFSDRGPHTLKGFPEPWHLYKLESTRPAQAGPGPGPVPPPQRGGEESAGSLCRHGSRAATRREICSSDGPTSSSSSPPGGRRRRRATVERSWSEVSRASARRSWPPRWP